MIYRKIGNGLVMDGGEGVWYLITESLVSRSKVSLSFSWWLLEFQVRCAKVDDSAKPIQLLCTINRKYLASCDWQEAKYFIFISFLKTSEYVNSLQMMKLANVCKICKSQISRMLCNLTISAFHNIVNNFHLTFKCVIWLCFHLFNKYEA